VHAEVQKVLEEFYQDDRAAWMDEYVPGDLITSSAGQATSLKRIDQDLIKQKIDVIMRPILEQWGGVTLASTHITYGLRKYLDGAKQKVQSTTAESHIFSAMFVVRSNVQTPWPIQVSNRHTGAVSTLTLSEDDMLLYAGKAITMGMPDELDGEMVVAFVHYKPENRDECLVGNCQYCGGTDDCSLPDPKPPVP
jgi:hypothetical protein